MKTTCVKKDFDCIEFKRKAQARIYEQIKDPSPQEEIEYFRKAAENGPLGESWKAARDRLHHAGPAAAGGS